MSKQIIKYTVVLHILQLIIFYHLEDFYNFKTRKTNKVIEICFSDDDT